MPTMTNRCRIKWLALGILLLAIMLGLQAAVPASPSVVTVQGRKVILQRRQADASLSPAITFTINGLNWSPVPVGSNNQADWANYYVSDLNIMSKMNVSVVRTYSPLPMNATGLAVLDYCYSHNIYMIMDVGYDTSNTGVAAVVNFFKNHPAILMFQVGNEWNYNNGYGMFGTSIATDAATVQRMAGVVKANDPNHPVTSSIGSAYDNTPYQNGVFTTCSNVDVWGFNTYLISDASAAANMGATYTSKPYYFSEIGTDAFNNNSQAEDQADQDTYNMAHWTSLVNASLLTMQGGTISGEVFFEFSDEWWKATGSPSVHDNGGFSGPFYDNFANEEWWGWVDVNRNPRQICNDMGNAWRGLNVIPSPVPVVTSPVTASGTVNQMFNYQITATNNPTAYAVTGLPAGLSLNPTTGLIWGVPTMTGTSTLQLAASNASGTSASVAVTLKIASAGTGSLTLAGATNLAANSSVNLTSVGVSDWRQWGQSGSTASNNANGNIISDQTLLVPANGVYQYGNNATGFSWTNGHPTTSASNVTTGDYAVGVNSGFQLTLQSSPTLQTATIYVGGWQSTGQLSASLGDGSAPSITSGTVSSTSGSYYVAFQINYSSSTSSPLTVKWTQTAGANGNVTLSAVAVAPASGGTGTGAISLVSATPAASTPVNLTTLGVTDWRQWGQSGNTGSNYANGNVISDQTLLVPANGVYQYANNTTSFTWTNGHPTGSANNVTTGVYAVGINSGFQVTLKSSPTSQTATIYVGGWYSTGQLTASLADGTAAPITSVTVSSSSGSFYEMYQISYSSSNSSPLTVKWTQTAGSSGNVTLAAIAVAPTH